MRKFKPGDKVLNSKRERHIVEGNYYPKGIHGDTPNAYTIYPPGKKKVYMYHVWAWEEDLTAIT